MALALLIAVAVSVWNMGVVMTQRYDLTWSTVLYLLALHSIPALIVGAIAPRRWHLAIILPWGAMLMGVAGLMAGSRGTAPYPSFWILLFYLLLLPLTALAIGFVGSRILTMRGRTT